jgi:hypothetical protein
MSCNCKHNHGGDCRRYPPVRAVENGRNVWQWPPASAVCGEKAEPEQVPAEGQNPAPKRATAPQRAKSKASSKGGDVK